MSFRPAYQLTEHPVGSLQEIWAVSWPLMLGLCSGSVMMFVDRLFLAHYSLEAMNAMAIGGLTSLLFLVFPFALCQITEVFVGRFHGEERNDMLAKPVWQVFWITLCIWPVLAFGSRLLTLFLFGLGTLETEYIVTLLDFSPFMMISVGLMGFFIGIGRTKIIIYAAISSNIINIILAPLFIYWTSLGIKGAAIAAGLAQGFQALYLFTQFFRRELRTLYATIYPSFDRTLIREMLRQAVPSGLGRLLEILAVVVFFKIIAFAGPQELTCASMVQTFYLLIVFCVDSISKGVTTVISNVVGARMYGLIPKIIYSAMKVHMLVFLVVITICFGFCKTIFSTILQDANKGLLQDPDFICSLQLTLLWMCIGFLFDGFSWIMSGHLMAMNDSKFIMYVISSVHWVTYVIPIYYLVLYAGSGAAMGWGLVAIDCSLMFLIFWYRSTKHVKNSLSSGSLQPA